MSASPTIYRKSMESRVGPFTPFGAETAEI
jgi:hypothetical protein